MKVGLNTFRGNVLSIRLFVESVDCLLCNTKAAMKLILINEFSQQAEVVVRSGYYVCGRVKVGVGRRLVPRRLWSAWLASRRRDVTGPGRSSEALQQAIKPSSNSSSSSSSSIESIHAALWDSCRAAMMMIMPNPQIVYEITSALLIMWEATGLII